MKSFTHGHFLKQNSGNDTVFLSFGQQQITTMYLESQIKTKISVQKRNNMRLANRQRQATCNFIFITTAEEMWLADSVLRWRSKKMFAEIRGKKKPAYNENGHRFLAVPDFCSPVMGFLFPRKRGNLSPNSSFVLLVFFFSVVGQPITKPSSTKNRK